MKTLDEIRKIKELNEGLLLKLPGVTGVDIGNKLVAGHDTGTPAIRVYVSQKKDVPSDQTIPKEVDGVPTDVIERRFVLH